MERTQINDVVSRVIPQTKSVGDTIKKRTVKDTFHIGGLSGNRLNSGTLRSQFIICEKESDWVRCDSSAKKAIHSDQRVFVQKDDDVWDVYKGKKLESETEEPELIVKNQPSLERLLLQARNDIMSDMSLFETGRPSGVEGHQIIYYGAPGTGKSHKIKNEVDEKNKICYRTTFHPDSDYSTFVGAYKPSMKPTGTILASGEKEEIIKYTFVPQAFTKAYVHAWSTKDEVFLVIEEINRGNCAQIFGDLFQLLDRKSGFSEYPIDADSDLESHIKEKLESSTRDDIPELVREGKKLMLPSNLYIWATMNTSDQSLFPIDSAFKRRWDWVYTPIKQHDEEYKIVLGDETEYDWWGFLEKINQVIDAATNSEDKKLGYFFVKAQDKVISPEKFVGKVLFYLWNDVFKNYGFDSPIFSKGENKKFTFSDFFTGSGEPDTEMVKSFLKKLDETIDKDKPFTKNKSEVAVNPEEVTEPA